MALAKIATIFMDLAEWAIVGLSPTFRKLYSFADVHHRGLLGFIAAKDLVKDLHGNNLDELSFRKAFEVASNMRSEPELNYWEFIRLYLMVDNPDMQRKRRYYRLYVSCAFVVIWLVVGARRGDRRSAEFRSMIDRTCSIAPLLLRRLA